MLSWTHEGGLGLLLGLRYRRGSLPRVPSTGAILSASPLLRIESGGDLVEFVLVRGRGNALTTRGLDQLSAELTALARQAAPPLVLRATGSSFCTGLDLDAARGLDRERMRGLMTSFHAALSACVAYPGPVVAAIGGHALAGGALLALACDLRLMAPGSARFGVHGVQFGVSYPDVVIAIARDRLGVRGAEHLLYGAHLLQADAALDAGWVDELVGIDELITRARACALHRVEGGRELAARAKLRIQHPLIQSLSTCDRAGMDAWLDQWFSEETQARLASRARSRDPAASDPPDPIEVDHDPGA